MKKYIKNQKGFTLIELCIGIVILPAILLMVWLAFSTCTASLVKTASLIENTQDVRGAMLIVNSEIQYAQNITSPVAGANGNLFTYDSGNSSISMGTGADSDKILIKKSTGTKKIKLLIDGVNTSNIDLNFSRNSTGETTSITLNQTKADKKTVFRTYKGTAIIINNL